MRRIPLNIRRSGRLHWRWRRGFFRRHGRQKRCAFEQAAEILFARVLVFAAGEREIRRGFVINFEPFELNNADVGVAAFPHLALLKFHWRDKRSGPIRINLFRRRDLLRRTGKSALAFSGPAGDMNLDGFEAAILHPQAELFVDFLDPVLLEAIAHARASGRDGRIAM